MNPPARLRILLIGLVLLLAACAAPAEPDPPAALVIAVPEGELAQAAQAAATAYSVGPGSGALVQVRALPGDIYDRETQAALLAGLDRFDLLILPANTLGKWSAYNALRPLDDLLSQDDLPMQDDGLAVWLPAVTLDERLMGLPTQPDLLVLWYRADLLEQAGLDPPRTWAEFLAAAQALNAPPERWGCVFPAGDLEAGITFAAVLPGFGVPPIPGGGPDLKHPGAVEALEFLAGLRLVHAVAPPGSGVSGADAAAALQSGQAALGLANLSAAADLLDCTGEAGDKSTACRDGQPLLRWTWLPGQDGQTVSGELSAWVIPLRAAHPEEAARFAAWLGSRAGALAWAAQGGRPAHSGVLADTGQAAAGPSARAFARLAQVDAFQHYLPPAAAVEQLWKPLHLAAYQALNGSRTPQTALAEAARSAGNALRAGGE